MSTFRLISVVLLFSSTSYSQTVVNGSITGTPPANSGITAGNAPGWTTCSFSPDLCDITFPSYSGLSNVNPVPSPDGGTWLGVASLGECAQTTITGLTIGSTYVLSFYGACFGTGTSIYNGGPAMPTITVGATSQSFTIPQAANIWNLYTMPFTANSTTMTLQVSAQNVSGNDPYYASLDGFTILLPLPTELIKFDVTANYENPSVKIDWSTASELENDYFVIEKSRDMILWTAVDKIDGKGTTNNPNDYTVTDFSPYTSTSYYRLVQVDFNGLKRYSETKSVTFSSSKDRLIVFPNPSDGKVQIEMNEEFDKLTITDAIGRMLYEGSDLSTNHEFSKGTYFIQVYLKDNTILTEKLTIK